MEAVGDRPLILVRYGVDDATSLNHRLDPVQRRHVREGVSRNHDNVGKLAGLERSQYLGAVMMGPALKARACGVSFATNFSILGRLEPKSHTLVTPALRKL